MRFHFQGYVGQHEYDSFNKNYGSQYRDNVHIYNHSTINYRACTIMNPCIMEKAQVKMNNLGFIARTLKSQHDDTAFLHHVSSLFCSSWKNWSQHTREWMNGKNINCFQNNNNTTDKYELQLSILGVPWEFCHFETPSSVNMEVISCKSINHDRRQTSIKFLSAIILWHVKDQLSIAEHLYF